MAEMFVAEMYLDFAVAARRARRIAALFDKATCVSRCPTGWGIHVSKDVLVRLRGQRLWHPPSRHDTGTNHEETDEAMLDDSIFEEDMRRLAGDDLFEGFEDVGWVAADKDEEDENSEIAGEIQGDTFSWARSGEDGWFYED